MRELAEYAALVESRLGGMVDSLGEIPSPLRDAMLYSLCAGGKRLRPALLLASCEAMGGDAESAMPFACGLEMIHTYSLIHDDLPCMDNDDLRRGRPTNHKVYGEAVAVLAGDGLLHGAMELMLRAACGMKDLRGVRAAEAIARRSGVTGMVAGQNNDVTLEGTVPTPEKVRYIHTHKTADLLTAPIEAGMLLAGADTAQLEKGIAYGQSLGIAFQIVDDLLDLEGDAAVLGKQTGMDAQLGKLTWPAAFGVEQSRRDAESYIRQACEAATVFGENSHWFEKLAEQSLTRVS